MRIDDVVAFRLGEFVHPPRSPLAGRTGVVLGFAVRHRDGVIVFDTGMCEGHPEIDRAFRPRGQDLGAALAAAGIARESVVAIANSHLHFDHCGQNRRFPGVPIFAQDAEYLATLRPFYTLPGCVEFPNANYHLLRGDAEILPGVRLLATPGHTPGHQSLVVETDGGLVLLAGQAVYTRAEYDGRAKPMIEGEHAQGSIARLRALHPRRVLFSHDPEVWEAR